MPETPKSRLAKMKNQLAITREQYLAAVKRQEHRAWANQNDPRRDAEMRILLAEARNALLIAEGKDTLPLPSAEPAEKPDPAVLDTEDQLRRDDAIIAAYLSDNPGEYRRSSARGHTHRDLLEYWRSSPEGAAWKEQTARAIRLVIEARERVVAEGS